jgi:hypothetical protein
MLKKSVTALLASSALLSAPSWSFDQYGYGYSNNAAAGVSSWNMSEPVLGVAPLPGVDITGVIYRYTAVKDRADPFTVSIQNENAIDGGYIFRETDDWSGKSGQTINKLVPVGRSPIKYWGRGSIETTGVGSVENANVVYTYRVDACFDPQNDPEFPIYNVMEDDAVRNATAETDRDLFMKDDEEASKKDDKDEDEKDLEKALAASDNALTLANGMSQNALLTAMNTAVSLNTYYAASIPGGAYKETLQLSDSNLPDNRRAFRGLAQQKLHTEMVNQQYGR